MANSSFCLSNTQKKSSLASLANKLIKFRSRSFKFVGANCDAPDIKRQLTMNYFSSKWETFIGRKGQSGGDVEPAQSWQDFVWNFSKRKQSARKGREISSREPFDGNLRRDSGYAWAEWTACGLAWGESGNSVTGEEVFRHVVGGFSSCDEVKFKEVSWESRRVRIPWVKKILTWLTNAPITLPRPTLIAVSSLQIARSQSFNFVFVHSAKAPLASAVTELPHVP